MNPVGHPYPGKRPDAPRSWWELDPCDEIGTPGVIPHGQLMWQNDETKRNP